MGRFEQVRDNLRRAYVLTRATVRASRVDQRDAIDDDDDLDPVESPAESAETPAHPSTNSRDDAEVPYGLRIAAAWSWRLLILCVALAGALWLVGKLRQVLIPLSIALLLAALLAPAVRFLRRRVRLPASLATGLVLITGLAAVAGTLTLVISQFVAGFPSLADKATDGLEQIRDWLRTGPLKMSNQQVNDAVAAASEWLEANRQSLATTTVSTAAATIEFLASMFLVLFATFFFLRDGKRIWRFAVRTLPAPAREHIGSAGEAAWLTLVSYVRATVLVAFIDALGVGLVLVILDVEFALPLAALVFLAAFVPIVGATVSGAVAVLVALVDEGPVVALVVLIAVILVQQLEGHVLQPLIMGRAVAIHPLAVIVAIAAGVVLAGIIGALVSVPIVAVLNTGIRHLVERRREPGPEAVLIGAHPSATSAAGQALREPA